MEHQVGVCDVVHAAMCEQEVDVLTQAVAGVKLVMGGFGEINEVKAKSQECGLEEDVFFPGWVRDEEKDGYLKSSSVFFLPSYSEGMPMSVLDAMGYGLPIVASNVGGIPKLIDGNGFMYEPGDIDGFAEGLSVLLTDEEKRDKMGRRSLEIIEQSYSLSHHIDDLETVYEDVYEKAS